MHHRIPLLARTPSFQPVASTSTAHLARPLVHPRASHHPGTSSHRHLASAAYGAQTQPKWDDRPPEPPLPAFHDVTDLSADSPSGLKQAAGEATVLGEAPATDERAVAAWERELDSLAGGFAELEDDFGGEVGTGRTRVAKVDKGKGRAVDLPTAEPGEDLPATAPTSSAAPLSSKPAKPQHILLEDHAAQPATRSPDLIATTLIRPFVPSPRPTDPDEPLQPHHFPLTSRHDWRLSSPLRKPSRTRADFPPSLWQHGSLALQGHNRFVGVGVEPGRSAKGGAAMRREEAWGWKVKVPETERGEWSSADVYRARLDRLIDLSKSADEKSYLELLARAGTPAEREELGITAARAVGQWLGDAGANAQRIEAARTLLQEDKEKLASGAKVVSVWSQEDGSMIGPEHGYRFTEGMILRFTPNRPEEGSSRPQLPPGAVEKHPQGVLIEINNGKLHVVFDETEMWDIGTGTYRIDEGLDDTSYSIQTRALANLYFDPDRQRARNEAHVLGAHQALANGALSTLREWSLQGSSIRELIVPDLDSATERRRLAHDAAGLATYTDPVDGKLKVLAGAGAEPETPVWEPKHPSELFKDNQLINSWIKRHQREVPLAMPGDPDLGLNPSQTRAVAMALGEKLSLIQGPPGTGKSATIVSIITLLKRHFRIPQPILLAAPTHVSVDHLLSLLIDAGLNPIRTGRASRVRETLRPWTVEEQRTRHPLWEATEAAREASEKAREAHEQWKEKTARLKTKPTAKRLAEGQALMEEYRKLWRRFVSYEHRLHASLLATADVFCSTAIGAGQNKVSGHVDFPIVFLDEAAMCTEPVSLIPLMKGAQQVTLIGDHKQLPAVIKSDAAKREQLHISLFERLIKTKAAKSVLLDTQYRMRPAISAFPNKAFYHSALQDAPSVSERPPAPLSKYLGVGLAAAGSDVDPALLDAGSVAFVEHDAPEQFLKNSLQNPREVDVIVDLVADLLQRNPTLDARDIGVVSPYFAQTRLLQDTFACLAADRWEHILGRQRSLDLELVEVNTVDAFQGREKSVVVLSTVRNNPQGRIGFLTDQRRLNVALTRAKDALFVVGNERTLRLATRSDWAEEEAESDSGVWRRYLRWMDQRGRVVEANYRKN